MQQQTKNDMKEALKKLIAKKSINKITIKEITDECGLNRMTFYYHFKDIYDLLEWSIQTEAYSSVQKDYDYKTWDEGLLKIFYVMLYNKKFYLDVMRSAGMEYFEKYLMRYLQNISEDLVDEETAGLFVDITHKSSLAEYYKYVLTSLIICWMKKGMRENPDYVVGYIRSIVKNGMSSTILSLRQEVEPYCGETQNKPQN